MFRIFIVIFLVLFIPLSAIAFRCDGRIVTKDMSKVEVLERCGPPLYIEDGGIPSNRQ